MSAVFCSLAWPVGIVYDLLIHNARLYPMVNDSLAAVETSLAVSDGKIAAIGVEGDAHKVIDARGACLLPGLIDCHTHAVYAGNRMNERVARLNGASYEEIARAGGGILSTVNAVAAASEDELIDLAQPRIQALIAEGVTTIEIKSGYGLDLDNERKMLRAIRRLGDELPITTVATFLGAHAVPKGKTKPDYISEVIDTMLLAVADEQLADAVDIFVENIGFDVEDMERLFSAAAKLGLTLRAHTEQLSNQNGSRRAAELGASSCDHLEYLDDAGCAAMAAAGTVAVLLPGAWYFLGETRKPPVGALRQNQVPMAIATDLNPGSSPIDSLLTSMHMASTFFGLTADEVLMGVTCHAARALGLAQDRGTLEAGKRADLSLWRLDSPEMLVYQLGGLAPEQVFCSGIAING